MAELRRTILAAFAAACRIPFLRGRVRISEWLFRAFPPRHALFEKNVGALRVELDLRDQQCRYIFFNSFERTEVAFLKRWLLPGQRVLDVGAHVGYLAAVMAAAVGREGRVLALEPSPINFPRLQRMAAGSHGRIEARQVAAVGSASESRVRLFIDPDHSMWGTVRAELGNANGVVADVPAATLGAIAASWAAAPPDFVKIDVEGAEVEVLEGFLPYLAGLDRLPVLFCELSAMERRELRAVVGALLEKPYRLYRFAKGRIVEFAIDQAHAPREIVNVLFVPLSQLERLRRLARAKGD